MTPGFFPQSAAVLLEAPAELSAVEAALSGFAVRETRPGTGGGGWVGGFPKVIVTYSAEDNGHVLVDVVDAPWPDEMGGGPGGDVQLFGAWTMGAFGPSVYPGGLARAFRHAASWQGGALQAARRHQAFLRLRLSYVLGATGGEPISPAGAMPLDEVLFLSRLALPLLQLPGALAFWNPNAELLLEAEQLEGRRGSDEAGGAVPLDILRSVREVDLGEGGESSLVDTVGMGQLGLPDLEALSRRGERDSAEVARWLGHLCGQLVAQGETSAPGHAAEGPGGRWICCARCDEPLAPPPRTTLRWSPEGFEAPSFVPSA